MPLCAQVNASNHIAGYPNTRIPKCMSPMLYENYSVQQRFLHILPMPNLKQTWIWLWMLRVEKRSIRTSPFTISNYNTNAERIFSWQQWQRDINADNTCFHKCNKLHIREILRMKNGALDHSSGRSELQECKTSSYLNDRCHDFNVFIRQATLCIIFLRRVYVRLHY